MSKHAYLVMAHKDLPQVQRLLAAVDHANNDIYVHADISFTECCEAALREAIMESQLFFQSNFHPAWGSFEQVRAMFSLLSEASSRHSYDYYHLLSGQDLPLTSQEEIHRLLSGCTYNFVHFSPKEEWPEVLEKRIGVKRYPILAASSALGRKAEAVYQHLQRRVGVNMLSPNVKYGFGSNWFSIKHDLASDFVRNFDWVEMYFSHGFCPDELVLQSFILTKGYENTLYSCNEGSYEACLREIDWSEGKSSPRTWTISDFHVLAESNRLFARKFDPSVDREVIDKVLKMAAKGSDRSIRS